MFNKPIQECEWQVTAVFVHSELKYKWYAITYTLGREGEFIQSQPLFDTAAEARRNWIDFAKSKGITLYTISKHKQRNDVLRTTHRSRLQAREEAR